MTLILWHGKVTICLSFIRIGVVFKVQVCWTNGLVLLTHTILSLGIKLLPEHWKCKKKEIKNSVDFTVSKFPLTNFSHNQVCSLPNAQKIFRMLLKLLSVAFLLSTDNFYGSYKVVLQYIHCRSFRNVFTHFFSEDD